MLSCFKYIVVFYNFFFWLLGVLILGGSAYLWWDSQIYLDLNELSEYYMTPFVAFLILGAVMTVVGFLGCCGAIRESSCILSLYFLFCMTMCIVCGASLYWANMNEDMVRDRIKRDMSKLIKVNYGSGKTNATELLVDRIQHDFICCGIVGPEDWIHSHYNNMNSSAFERGISAHLPEQGTYRIPTSCCQPDSSECMAKVDRIAHTERLSMIHGLNSAGCMQQFEEFIRHKWQLIILIGCALIGVQVFALLFACVLCCAITRQEDK
ncbi:hypothetical protein BLOT_006550 [Blomia tropicalis]|nr:hypothetical protein BLOT_006550 [Blomia tropicalis]